MRTMQGLVRRWAVFLVILGLSIQASGNDLEASEANTGLGSGRMRFQETSAMGGRRELLQSTPGVASSGNNNGDTSSGEVNAVPPAPPAPQTARTGPATGPAVATNGSRSAPAPSPRQGRAPSPAPGPSNHSSAPAPAPRRAAPVPAPGNSQLSPGPAPSAAPADAPAPAPQAEGMLPPSAVPAPAPQAQAPEPAPVSAPVPEPVLAEAPVPEPASQPSPELAPQLTPQLGPAPELEVSSPAPAVSPDLVPAVAPGESPEEAPTVSAALGSLAPGQGTPTPAPEQEIPTPAPAPVSVPTNAPMLPAFSPAPNPAEAFELQPLIPTPATAPAPGSPPAQSLEPLSPSPAAESPTNPDILPALVALGPVSGPAADIPSSALSPEGLLAPGSPSALPLAPILAPALAEVYPAGALPPAGPGQVSTLVTIPATESGSTVTQLDPATGQIVPATPESLASGGELFAQPGALSFIVQTSETYSDLPASAINVQGGSVTSTSPVEGSGGRLFNVNVNTASGASFLAISTIAGVGLADGLLTTASNTVTVNLMSQNPQTTITSGEGYRSGDTVTPSFTIDFGGRVVEENPEALYTLTGASRTDVVYDYGNGRIFIMAYILQGQEDVATDITVSVAAGVTTDPAGNPNTAASYTYLYRPKSQSYTIVSNVANGVSGASLAVALATPIVLGTMSTTGAAQATVTAAGTFYMLHILSSLQYVYLAGRMNVANMPDNFRQVSDSLSWSVLNFRAPWQTAEGNQVSDYQATHGFPSTPQGISTGSFGSSSSGLFNVAGRRLLEDTAPLHRNLLQLAPALAPLGASNGTITLPNVAGGSSQYVVTSTGLNTSANTESSTVGSISQLSESVSTAALGNGDDPYETVWRSLFWLALAMVAITLLVMAAVAFILYKRWPLPPILQAPRPQIMLLMFGVPAIAQSSAGLFAGGDGKAIAVGVIIVCFLPFLMVLYGAIFVWRHILPAEGRRAAWVLTEDPEAVQNESSWWSKVLDVIVGPRGSSGVWMALKRRDSQFVNQYGPFFEVNRGPPMVLTDVTYETDPETGFCNRGRLQQVYEAPILKLGRFTLYPYHLQGQNSGLELMVAIATAILLQAFTQPSSYAQVILLICLNVLLLVWMRVIRPAGGRAELIMAMMGTLSILGIYICGLILLANPDASDGFRNRVGIAMLVLGLWSVVTFILGLISFIMTTISLYKELRNWLFPSKDPAQKFANTVYGVMAKDEYILARKFGDRWLYKALGSGLHGRVIHRREKADPRQRLYNAVLHIRPKAAKKPARVGRLGQTAPGLGSGPSPAEKVGGLQWPGMAQMSKLKAREREEREQKEIDGSPDDSPNQYLDTGDHTPLGDNTSGGTSPGSSGGDHPTLGIRDFLGNGKAHPAAPQSTATPLGSRQNQAEPVRRETEAAQEGTPGPQVVIDFAESGIAPVPQDQARSPDRRRRRAESPRYFRSDNKENQ